MSQNIKVIEMVQPAGLHYSKYLTSEKSVDIYLILSSRTKYTTIYVKHYPVE